MSVCNQSPNECYRVANQMQCVSSLDRYIIRKLCCIDFATIEHEIHIIFILSKSFSDFLCPVGDGAIILESCLCTQSVGDI